jgi:hypothetical protein
MAFLIDMWLGFLIVVVAFLIATPAPVRAYQTDRSQPNAGSA